MASTEELDELDEYVFVVRMRIGEDGSLNTHICC
jgi:hypothetical protein